MNLSIIGTKGAGKGTQISRLVDNFNLVYFSPGAMFRQAAKNRTPLGLIAERAINRGDLVPDDIVNGMVEEWLWTTTPSQSIVFDGFPRTVQQAEFLEQSLKEMKRKMDALIYLEVGEKAIIERLAGRRTCRLCRDEFHLVSAPWKTCPYHKCDGQFLRPFDEDRPEVLMSLVHAFDRGIQPLLSFYKKRKKLIRVDGEGEADAVNARIVKLVSRYR